MIVAGKCPPEKEELEQAKNFGFENVELYMERQHIDDFEGSVENCRKAEVNIVSIHTPHVPADESEYFERTAEMAEELDAKMVFHSKYIHHINIPQLEELDIDTEYGYENNPGVSAYALENLILGRGHQMVLDTAHLYMAEKDFLDALEHFTNHRDDRIKVIHVADSTKIKDGLGFGKGEMNMEQTCKMIADSNYDGIVVLEVMPEYQEEALEKWRKWTDY